MKIALVTPYDWATPGGVNEHVAPLAERLIASGHEIRIVAPASRRNSHTPAASRAMAVAGLGRLANAPISLNVSPGPMKRNTCSRPSGEDFTAFSQPN